MVGVGYRRAVVGIVEHVAVRLRTGHERVVRITEAVFVRVGVVSGGGHPYAGVQRITVVAVGYAVAVDIVVADVTLPVAVQIGLIVVGYGRTVVNVIRYTVTVGVGRGGDHLNEQRVGTGRSVVIRDRQHHFVVAGG